jgi:ABC-type glycerol-3-phosphate transport system substrate-binding protein
MGPSRLLAVVWALSGLLSACGAPGTSGLFGMGSSITVLAELSSKADPSEQARVKAVLRNEIDAFKRINPQLNIRFRALPTDRLEQELSYRTQRGLGPDLLLLASNRDLIGLQQKGYISPIALSAQEQSNFRRSYLEHLRYRGQQLAVPFLVVPPLACFDRRRLPQSPPTLAAIIRLGQEKHAFGLNSSFDGLDEITSGFGITLFPEKKTRSPYQNRVLKALKWYREANLQPQISFVDNEEELRQGLMTGRFEWVPCSSGWLPTLQKALGTNLGTAVLPAGPKGPAKPVLRMPLWVFGAQSNPRQRQFAKQFVLFTTNVVNQRAMALELGTVLPVNPSIALPLKAYPTLAIMDTALKNSTLTTLEQKRFLLKNANQIGALVDQVITGVQSPNAVAPQIQNLLDGTTTTESHP